MQTSCVIVQRYFVMIRPVSASRLSLFHLYFPAFCFSNTDAAVCENAASTYRFLIKLISHLKIAGPFISFIHSSINLYVWNENNWKIFGAFMYDGFSSRRPSFKFGIHFKMHAPFSGWNIFHFELHAYLIWLNDRNVHIGSMWDWFRLLFLPMHDDDLDFLDFKPVSILNAID